MQYINPQNEYPRFYGDIMLENPGWQLGDDLPEGWVLVADAEAPNFELGVEKVKEVAPALVDGVMTQQWEIEPLTAEELERINAPATAKAKLLALGLTEIEIQTLLRGL